MLDTNKYTIHKYLNNIIDNKQFQKSNKITITQIILEAGKLKIDI